MKIILLESIEKLGEKGEVKEVKKGYFRNFLFPCGLAKTATTEEVIRIEKEMEKKEKAELKARQELEQKAEELTGQKIEIGARLIGGRKIFGSVKAKDIAEALGLKVSVIKLKSPIKEAGEHKIKVDFGKGVKTEVLVSIVSKKKKKNK
jgi:large subunit ribosomal protein L9